MNAVQSLAHFIPESILIVTGFLILVLDLFSKPKRWLGWLALAGTTGALAYAAATIPGNTLPLFYGYFTIDPFSVFFRITALVIITVTILMALAHKGTPPKQEGELYALLAFIGTGLILMAASTNLLMIFISIEFVSLTSYILAGFEKHEGASNEASLKYLLFGSVASATMLYGMSLLFGLTGSVELNGIRDALAGCGNTGPLLLIAMALLFVGLSFKISAAPFHMWAPDVYTGAPTPIAGFLTVGPKAMGFAILLRVLFIALPALQKEWSSLFAVLSALTMTVGNIAAVSQTNIKRLLAYSSIAQAGYILMGIAAANAIGLEGILFYIAAYALTNLGAFTIVIVVVNQSKSEEISSFAGLAKRSPFIAASLAVFFVSLAGIPPLAGYFGKVLVFAGVIEQKLVALAVIAAVNSAIAAFYYFKVVKEMYLTEPADSVPAERPFPAVLATAIAFLAIAAIGIFPAPLLHWASRSLIF
ncbi:MAG TPA: NADH-quinone oxidoreductase subunit N [Candidatus Omnitrophota bacterium]|nr:NADH-quinone oxidoreductase subunit N [Candidatus Omnitrophota bacterium]